MKLPNFLTISQFLLMAALLLCGLAGMQSRAAADDHVLTLTIAWNNEVRPNTIMVKREGLTRAVGDTDRWVFRLALAPDLIMTDGPHWTHTAQVGGQNWGDVGSPR